MSSAHIIIVARNHTTGALELPLDDLTLYSHEGAESVLQTARRSYGEDWVLSLYEPVGEQWSGAKQEPRPC